MAHWLAVGKSDSKARKLVCDGNVNWQGRAPRGLVPQCRISPARLVDSFREILQVERDKFWSWHWTFRSARLKKPQPLLGDARVTDLAVNVILPWLWTRAAEGKNKKLQRVVEHRHAVWPQAEDNSILKLARQRLLGVGQSPHAAERFRAAGVDSNHARLLRALERGLRKLPVPGTGARLE